MLKRYLFIQSMTRVPVSRRYTRSNTCHALCLKVPLSLHLPYGKVGSFAAFVITEKNIESFALLCVCTKRIVSFASLYENMATLLLWTLFLKE